MDIFWFLELKKAKKFIPYYLHNANEVWIKTRYQVNSLYLVSNRIIATGSYHHYQASAQNWKICYYPPMKQHWSCGSPL